MFWLNALIEFVSNSKTKTAFSASSVLISRSSFAGHPDAGATILATVHCDVDRFGVD